MERFTYNLAKNARCILDIGTGPNGSDWWKYVSDDAKLFGLDLYFEPVFQHKSLYLIKMDAVELDKIGANDVDVTEVYEEDNTINRINRKVNIFNKFDLVIADHVFEHVSNPERLAKGIFLVTKDRANVHIAIPDPTNFTDRFYHLIHPDGGGHVSFLKKEELIQLMESNNFKFINYQIWEDDWVWLEECYSSEKYGNIFSKKEDLKYIADVFRKELTSEKGYFYGGEFIFKKIKGEVI